MRITDMRIRGYRCLEDVSLDVDSLTVLIGANGSGKSSVLRALNWFFDGGDLEIEDIFGGDVTGSVLVEVGFTDLNEADRIALGSYGKTDEARFWRTWSSSEGTKLTGRGLAYPPFEEARATTSAADLKLAYEAIRSAGPTDVLPSYTNAATARSAMLEWEAQNKDLLEAATSSATHLFGIAGKARLAGRFDFVFIPAVTDVESEMRSGRGSLLSRLLSLSTLDAEKLDNKLLEIRSRLEKEISRVVGEEHSKPLLELAKRVTGRLQEYVPGGSIKLGVESPQVSLPKTAVGVRLAHDGMETDVGRQGHGLQRALLVATLQELAQMETDHDRPALMLAIEEPELFQHPTQARHFASVLDRLSDTAGSVHQVIYATHSPYFVDPGRFEQLRRFSKPAVPTGAAVTRIVHATLQGVTTRLEGVVPEEEIRRRVETTVRRTLSEAVFARAVLLVEGISDAALLSGLADRSGGFDASGVAVVAVHGKSLIPIAWAILMELGIPVMTLFDGDAGIESRLLAKNQTADIAAAAAQEARDSNVKLLQLNGQAANPSPTTGVYGSCAVFEDRLEELLEDQWPELLQAASSMASETGDPREKPQHWYREAAGAAGGSTPSFLEDVVANAFGLVGS